MKLIALFLLVAAVALVSGEHVSRSKRSIKKVIKGKVIAGALGLKVLGLKGLAVKGAGLKGGLALAGAGAGAAGHGWSQGPAPQQWAPAPAPQQWSPAPAPVTVIHVIDEGYASGYGYGKQAPSHQSQGWAPQAPSYNGNGYVQRPKNTLNLVQGIKSQVIERVQGLKSGLTSGIGGGQGWSQGPAPQQHVPVTVVHVIDQGYASGHGYGQQALPQQGHQTYGPPAVSPQGYNYGQQPATNGWESSSW